MKITKASHFWDWLARNQEDYVSLLLAPPEERAFRMHELVGHVTAYQRHLTPIMILPARSSGRITVIFTANGWKKYFKMAERLVMKAPQLEGWEFFSLHPPVALEAYIQRDLEKLNLEANSFWVERPRLATAVGAVRLTVYVDTVRELTDDHFRVVDQAVFNVLGERSYGLCLAGLEMERCCELSKGSRAGLMRLHDLGKYIAAPEESGLMVNGQGLMERRR